ncbi:MAG: hypothetical protein HYX94_13090 [Chloroflexi bacterium]|nr:hypothetical protein [Chloroflexota bacterium]
MDGLLASRTIMRAAGCLAINRHDLSFQRKNPSRRPHPVCHCYTLTVSGDWTNTGGTYNANSGGVIFNKTGTATLSKTGAGSTETFCNLTISNTTTLDVSDDYLSITGGCALANNGIMRREAPAQNATANTRLSYNDPLGYPTVALTSTGSTDLGSTPTTITVGQTPPSCNGNAFGGTPARRWYQITPSATSSVSPPCGCFTPLAMLTGPRRATSGCSIAAPMAAGCR